MKLTERLKQKSFESPAHEAILNVLVTGSWLSGALTHAMAPFGITPAQYNVLRILRGSKPDCVTCSEIGSRLLDRTPDVTRLLNRLQVAGLVSRERSDNDRRVVEVTITQAGCDLLKRMKPEIERVQAGLSGQLSEREHEKLSRLLEKLRAEED